MNIDESQILDPEYYDEEKALACLLTAGLCFLNTINIRNKEAPAKYTTLVFVIANDIFAWGCADSECLTNNDGEEGSEIIALYKLWKENSKHGAVKWLCLKRKEQPQQPIKESMIKDNYWDESLESLPENYYDKARREQSTLNKKP